MDSDAAASSSGVFSGSLDNPPISDNSTNNEVGSLSPKKLKIETPRFIKPFLRSGYNKRPGRNFFLAFLIAKMSLVIAFLRSLNPKRQHSGSYKQYNDEIGYVIIELKENLKTEEFVKMLSDRFIIVNTPLICEYIKDFNLIFNFLKSNNFLKHDDLYELPERNTFNYELFTDYAVSRKIMNPLTLTYEYSEISKNDKSEFFSNYTDHFENSKLFVAMADRHKHSSAATKVVLSYETEYISRTSNEQYLINKINEIIQNWFETDDITRYEYVSYVELMRKLHGQFTLLKLCMFSFKYFQIGKPKQRWIKIYRILMPSFNTNLEYKSQQDSKY